MRILIGILAAAFIVSGCTTTQGNAKDMVEFMVETDCKVTQVDVRSKRYKINTDCSDAN